MGRTARSKGKGGKTRPVRRGSIPGKNPQVRVPRVGRLLRADATDPPTRGRQPFFPWRAVLDDTGLDVLRSTLREQGRSRIRGVLRADSSRGKDGVSREIAAGFGPAPSPTRLRAPGTAAGARPSAAFRTGTWT